MKYKLLPNTQIKVSCICLGTMTFGRQNTENDGHQQLDYAFDHGVNFIDTAEMYPVPAEATRYGNTERIIGSWIKKSGKRKVTPFEEFKNWKEWDAVKSFSAWAKNRSLTARSLRR